MNLELFEPPGIMLANPKYIVLDPQISPEIEKRVRGGTQLVVLDWFRVRAPNYFNGQPVTHYGNSH